MSVEPTQALGETTDAIVADGTLRLPEGPCRTPTVRGAAAERPRPSDEDLTDLAPPTIAGSMRENEPGSPLGYQPGGTGLAHDTMVLPTAEAQWTEGLAPNRPRQGSGASPEATAVHGDFKEGQLVFNKYDVVRLLGRGGMGAVWLVRHNRLNVNRALKVISGRISYDEQARARFRLEAQVMASCPHPNALVVHDADLTENGVGYIEMEYVEGHTLAETLIKGVPAPLEWTARILDQLCDVLQVAHKKKIVHRDLKPANLMLADDCEPGREQLKVLDFGIAKIIADVEDGVGGPRTMTGHFVGTPYYASPEQIDGRADTRSDIYSVGVILFELLTGFRPFRTAIPGILLEVMTKTPPTFRDVNPEVEYPPEVEALVMRCLAKSAQDRPQTAREVSEEFRAAALPQAFRDRPPKPDSGTPPPSAGRSPPVKAMGTLCAASVVVAILLWTMKTKPDASVSAIPPPGATALLPSGFAAAPKTDLDDRGRPLVMVPTGRAEPLKMNFVLVTGGKFAMGMPPNTHSETVGDFALGETEVTNAQMRTYLKATATAPPAGFEEAITLLLETSSEEEANEHPAVSIPRDLMVRFARWVGGDLPTTAQWEYAARSKGKADRYYVWADTLPPKFPLKANSGLTNIARDDGDTRTTTVRSFPRDKTEQGAFDMMGNVREWCRDEGKHPAEFLVRGCSWKSFADDYSNFAEDSVSGTEVSTTLGFRVVVELTPPDRTVKSAILGGRGESPARPATGATSRSERSP